MIMKMWSFKQKKLSLKKLRTFLSKILFGSGGIRTHASEETGALNQRLRPLGHATLLNIPSEIVIVKSCALKICGFFAGIASAFGAPVGGLLFAMEEVSSFWKNTLSWQVFFCCMTATFTTGISSPITRQQKGWCQKEDFLSNIK